MADSPQHDDRSARLRQRAESLLDDVAPADMPTLSAEEAARLRHELRASQEELDRQREELRRAQAELAAMRGRYEALYDFAPFASFLLDADGVVVQANRKGATMLGLTRSELLGRTFAASVAEADRGLFTTHLAQIITGDDPRRAGPQPPLETRLVHRDGSVFYAAISAESRQDVAGTPHGDHGAHLMVADVSARRESDEARRLAERILEASPAFLLRAIMRDGAHGRVEYVSPNIARFGFSPQELLSGALSPRDLVHPDDLPGVLRAIDKNARAGIDAFALDYRLAPRDGQTRYVIDRIRLSRGACGDVIGIEGLALDVTGQTLARKDLETVLDSAPIPIVKVRVTDTGDRVLAYQNPAASRLFGPDALAASCKNFLCNTETCPALSADSGLVRDRECAVKTPFGERIMYKTARKLPDEPAIIEAMVDVTELMRTRERLTRAMEAAESASQAKSEFLATMSHEIRTPINGIMGMTELALQTDLTAEQREYLELARQSSLSLLDIINDILDFSRVEAGRMELARERFSLRASLDRCLRLFQTQAARQHDALECVIAPDVPDALLGDGGRLVQVLGNLVSNGLKFTKDGRVRVRIETTPAISCPLDQRPADPVTLLFSVTDTGIGIAADKQRRIFEAFTQLDGGLTRGAGGTGLGLAICTNLVRLMGGRLWVESRPGEGSAFFFTAVFDQPADVARREDAAAAAAAGEPGLVPLSILLVEDNAINLLVAKRLLERRGHTVTAVDSGQAALDALTRRAFDCVLLDVEMPDLNGLETLARLRDTAVYGPRAATPVVALTAHAIKGYRERILAAGFDDYVAKPIDMRLLGAALRRVTAAATDPA